MSYSYPHPAIAGKWCKYETFRKYPIERSQWVHYQYNVEQVLNGKYENVYPLHFELVSTTMCNFQCSWCNYRQTMERFNDGEMKNKNMNFELMSKIIDELSKKKIGIQWTGGEPLINPDVIVGINYATRRKINQCLFTNGLLLTPTISDNLLKTNLKFVRVSLNAISIDIHAEFHGYSQSKKYITKIIRNIEYFALRKNELKSQTLLGVSIVYDKRNAMDIENILKFVNDLQIKYNGNAIDYVIIRPAFKMYNNEVELDRDINFHVKNAINNERNLLNVKLIYPQFNNTMWMGQHQNMSESSRCLSYGWFGEILHNGDVLLCSDTYGNPEYIIGNLKNQSLEDIWYSSKRRKTIKKINNKKCLINFCPKTGRGYYLNQIFHQIERYRKKGNIDIVVNWLDDLKRNIPKPDHSFFI